jgi:hypothetical protein
VVVAEGNFTAVLNTTGQFGGSAFNGETRWLETAVRCPAGSGEYITLTPRQPLDAAPLANYALRAPWNGVAGIPTGFADGVDNDTTYSAGTGLTLTGAQFSADLSLIQQRVAGVCGAGFAIRQVNGDGSVTCEPVTGGGAHTHWGESWSGSGTGLTLSGGSVGLSGSGSTAGVSGTTSVSNGAGVSGSNSATSGSGAGVSGQSAATDGRGVTGSNTAVTGQNYGVYGTAASTSGRGVTGHATATTGGAIGVTGQSDSTSGRGVYGYASAASGTTSGVYGQVASTDGWAGYFHTTVGNGLYINAPAGKVGLNVAGGGSALVNGNAIWHAGNDGATSGLDADLLEGQHGSYYLTASNIQAGTLGTNYYSAYGDLGAEGYLGNASGDLALNNGTVNTNLNADLLDGQSASDFATSSHSHDHGALTGLSDDDHPQYFSLSQNETVSGIPSFNGGTTFVDPPFNVDSAFLVTNLNADRVDGYNAGNANGNIPINNNTLNVNLNADLLDGQHAGSFAASSHNHWGASWSGSGVGLTLTGGIALVGHGNGVGVSGQATGYPPGTGGKGVEGYADFGVGVWGESEDGIGIFGSGTSYAGFFDGNIYVDGACVGCMLAVFGVNGGERALQPGDVVTIRGIQASALDNAPALWEVVLAGDGAAVVGVVNGRAELVTIPSYQNLYPDGTGKMLVPREGEAKPGEYLSIVIYGPMQVRAEGAEAITAGARLTVGVGGVARPLRTTLVNGITLAESAPIIGTALGVVDADGLVWVLVNPH